jgi:phosphoserine phosphatase RsbU/P
MSQVNLKKLLARKEVLPIINSVLSSVGKTVSIQDADGNVIIGKDFDSVSDNAERKPIQVGEEILGWVSGIGLSSSELESVVALVTYIANREVEKKGLAAEALARYKEINLFYQLSEKITASLELPVVGGLIIEEARKLIKTTSGSVMLLNKELGTLEVVSAFGQANHTNVHLKPGEGIAGSVFTTGKGEIVNEVSTDPRFIPGENPVSSIICAPLKTRDKVIGVVNFSNKDPITYTASDLQLLSALAAQAAQAIENALFHESQVKDAVARNEIEKGQKMQRDFLPDHLPKLEGWDLAALFKPARQVAGDFYDTFILPGGGVGLVIADVCDKGVGSALFMALFRSLIRVFSGELLAGNDNLSPNDQLSFPSNESEHGLATNLEHVHALRAVRLTNDYVAETHSTLNMFATLFFGVLDPVTGILTYVNGGHEPLAIVDSNGIKERLKPTGPAVGMMPNMKFRIQQTRLELGDMLVGYTDGVPEAKSPNSKFYTEERFLTLLEHPPSSATEMLDLVDRSLIEHIANADQFDDITMLAVRRLPNIV